MRMIQSTINSIIHADICSVWNVVTSLQDCSWRSDIQSMAISDEKHFQEISKTGISTHFTIALFEPYSRYAFNLENENLAGSWLGCFEQTDAGTKIIFLERITVKKWWLYSFVKLYLSRQQKRYVADLKRKCERHG